MIVACFLFFSFAKVSVESVPKVNAVDSGRGGKSNTLNQVVWTP
jgi:hypothetical protein